MNTFRSTLISYLQPSFNCSHHSRNMSMLQRSPLQRLVTLWELTKDPLHIYARYQVGYEMSRCQLYEYREYKFNQKSITQRPSVWVARARGESLNPAISSRSHPWLRVIYFGMRKFVFPLTWRRAHSACPSPMRSNEQYELSSTFIRIIVFIFAGTNHRMAARFTSQVWQGIERYLSCLLLCWCSSRF